MMLPVTAALFPGLTPREHEALELVARGRPNTDASRVLGVSGKTVRNHVKMETAPIPRTVEKQSGDGRR